MIRVLLDTDHVSLHERGHLPLRARLASYLPEEVAVSIVTVEEMLRGRLAILARRSAGEARVHAYMKLLETVYFCSTIPVLPFDMACEQQFQALHAMRLRVGSRDLRIAATALVQNVVLVTRNRRDFEPVPGLRLDDWSL
ncbi:MAG: type II toxin-antitoxin system VapC family toxin [Candidatus Tectomicrobia bacterium]|uniref:Type II toxin-antitoxin system VapC family toxin n=1 Tax=Tectimicrobiota bacterium TaxID=2528274 RepID=A0A938B2K5_UNCTE|nr:type II toxin-antitoxin system VapC family toxin [Candidatus Tectomicrobia bacterium]